MNIPLLADKNQSVSRAYGVLKEGEGISFRGLFIIDGKSKLRQVIWSLIFALMIIGIVALVGLCQTEFINLYLCEVK